LRNVLHNQVGKFENMKVEWVHGHAPTAFFYNDKKEEVSKVEIGDKDLTEMLNLFKEKGFQPTAKKIELGVPIKSMDFEGNTYELYKPALMFEEAMSIVQSKNHNNVQGYLLTITSENEHNFVSQLLEGSGVDAVWLGAQDQSQEGTWTWISGPEKGVAFWKDGNTQTFSRWRELEPNNVNNENCAIISRNAISGETSWNDVQCESLSYSIVVKYPKSKSPSLEDTHHEDL